MASDPNEIIDHVPDYCEYCGKDIGALPGKFVERKQVIDLPPIKPVVTEHRVYKKRCSCGHITMSSFPGGLQAPVSAGLGSKMNWVELPGNTMVFCSLTSALITPEVECASLVVTLSITGILYFFDRSKAW
ncbi:MAG: IS66 family transposase zinc-finger binding domain-containing protein [Bacteroidales bacterium]